jgi:hypothetical protein
MANEQEDTSSFQSTAGTSASHRNRGEIGKWQELLKSAMIDDDEGLSESIVSRLLQAAGACCCCLLQTAANPLM